MIACVYYRPKQFKESRPIGIVFTTNFGDLPYPNSERYKSILFIVPGFRLHCAYFKTTVDIIGYQMGSPLQTDQYVLYLISKVVIHRLAALEFTSKYKRFSSLD
jgi:hypothetical protein